MRATIEQKQTDTVHGLIFKKTRTSFDVIVQIELTDAERAVLDRFKLWDHVLYHIPNPRYEIDLEDRRGDLAADPGSYARRHPTPMPSKNIGFTIEQFCNGHVRSFPTPGEAKNCAGALRTHAKELKEIIEHNSSIGKKETLDL